MRTIQATRISTGAPVCITSIHYVDRTAQATPADRSVPTDPETVPLSDLRFEPGKVVDDWTANCDRPMRLIVANSDGTGFDGALANITCQRIEGVEVVGNGTLQYPLTARIAKGFRLVKDAAPVFAGEAAEVKAYVLKHDPECPDWDIRLSPRYQLIGCQLPGGKPGWEVFERAEEIPPAPATLDLFDALIQAIKLGPAKGAEAKYHAILEKLAEDCTQTIKRERAFAATPRRLSDAEIEAEYAIRNEGGGKHAPARRETPRAVIVIEDGVAEHVVSSVPMEITIFDMDASNHDIGDAHEVTDPSNGKRRHAWIRTGEDHEVAPEKVDLAFREAQAALE